MNIFLSFTDCYLAAPERFSLPVLCLMLVCWIMLCCEDMVSDHDRVGVK